MSSTPDRFITAEGTSWGSVLDSLYENLDAQQFQAVCAPMKPLLIVAGAGTGKTRTLMARCAHIIASGVAPERILLCTFTLKAAQEMRARIQQWVGPMAQALWAGTFHHVGHRLLRMYATAVGLKPDFSILDATDALDLLGLVVSDLRVPAPLTAQKCQTVFSLSLASRCGIESLVDTLFPELAEHGQTLLYVYSVYQRRKRFQHVVDFDDLLEMWMQLLEHPEYGEKLRGMFDHVLVDEYQDTNPLQAAIIFNLVQSHRHVTVVGDDAQSIYSFRGANLDTFQEFLQCFPEAQILKLEQNYRSVQPILDLANVSLGFSSRVIPKKLISQRPSTQLPIYVRCSDTHQEAQFIAQRLWQLHIENGVPLHEIAVLTRTNAQSVEIQLEFSRRGIPFRVQGGLRVLEQAHFKDFIAYLRLISNPTDEMALTRVFRLIPGLGSSTARKVVEEIVHLPADTLLYRHPLARREVWMHLPKRRREALLDFGQWLESLSTVRSDFTALLARVFEKYLPILKTKYDRVEERIEELQQLIAIGSQYTTVDAMLVDFGFQSGSMAEVLRMQQEPEGRVVVSTVHQSKGLEWQIVFLASLCEGAFPLVFSRQKDGDKVEEERRIFHVAITRAKDELYLSFPMMSVVSDRSRVFRRPSRFITEVPPQLYETWEIEVKY